MKQKTREECETVFLNRSGFHSQSFLFKIKKKKKRKRQQTRFEVKTATT